jgi:hypothetical protein
MKKSVLAATALSMLLAAGCASQKSWVYAPSPFQDKQSLSSKKAVVQPFDDLRENINSNLVMLYLIPLFPFGWQDFNVPEGSQTHMTSGLWVNYKPTEDFAKALATELQNARIFKEAHFDFGRGDADIIVNGKILGTQYSGKVISYGLSAFGPLLWLFGLPATTLSNDLSIELRCIDAGPNRQLFSKTYKAPTYSKTGWIYSLPSDFNYPAMLKGLYNEFLSDLSAHSAAIAAHTARTTLAL